MKRFLAASLVILTGLFLSPQPEAFTWDMGVSGFETPGGGSRPVLDLDFRNTFDSRIDYAGASEKTCFNSSGTLVTFASGVPRLPCFTSDGATNIGFRIEEAATNIEPNSETICGTGWTDFGSVISCTEDAATAPDGTTTADLLIATFAGRVSSQTISGATTGRVFTISLFAKLNTGPPSVKIILQENGGAQAGAEISNTALVLTTSWQRLAATGTIVENDRTNLDFIIVTQEAPGEILIWGAQAEETPVATSYIVTAGSTATRAADVATMHSFATDIVNTVEGTFLVEALLPNLATGTDAYLFRLESEAQASDEPHINMIGSGATSDRLFARLFTSVENSTMNVNDLLADTSQKHAFAYAANDLAAVTDGGTVVTDSSATMETGYDEFHIGSADGDSSCNCYLASIKYWNRRLSDGRLIDKTAFLDLFDGTMFAANDNEEEGWLEAVGW
jgi:hypothetical protein